MRSVPAMAPPSPRASPRASGCPRLDRPGRAGRAFDLRPNRRRSANILPTLSMRVTAHGLEANDPIVTVTPSSPPPRPADWAIGTQTPPRRVVGGRPFRVAARRHSAATKAALCSRLCHDRGLLRAQPADRGLARARCRACRFAPAPRAGARWFRRQDGETMTMHAAIYARDTILELRRQTAEVARPLRRRRI